MSVFIFWIAYLSSPNTGKYVYFLKIPISPILSSRLVYVTPSLHPIQFFLLWLNQHLPLFVFFHNQLQHLLPPFFNLSYPAILIYPLKMTLTPLNRRRTYLCSISSREFEECPNKAEDRTWRKRSQSENRKPVPWNRIRLLLFHKCKFTKSLNWKKCWTRQYTHRSHIYQI